jgi:hypothetical protein
LLLVLLVGQGIRRRFQAAAAARQPRPGAPREPYEVLTDLRRPGTGRRTFYAFVNEYLTSLAYHQNRQPMAGPERTAVLEACDRWLYGPDEAAAREALPADEQRHTLEVLCRL